MQSPKFLFAVVASMAVASTMPVLAQDPHQHDAANQAAAPAAQSQCAPGMPSGGMPGMQQGMGKQDMMQMMQHMQQMHSEMQQMHKEMMEMHREMKRARAK